MEPYEFSSSNAPVALMIFVATLGASIAAFLFPSFMEENIFHPYSVARGRRLHTIITSNLIHANIPHLLFNMLAFYFFAFRLQEHLGAVNFFLVYLGSMLLADFPTLLNHKDNPIYRSLGASGAISGVVFSFILFEPNSRMGLLFFPVRIPAYIFGPLYVAYSYYMGKRGGDNINHDAHLWGAIGGLLFTLMLRPAIFSRFLAQIGLG